MIQSNCILLAGNNANELTGIQQLIISQQLNIEIVICSPAEILLHVKRCNPVMVLFYLSNAENPYAAYIKELRENQAFDEIPLYIYPGIPTTGDIKALLEKLS